MDSPIKAADKHTCGAAPCSTNPNLRLRRTYQIGPVFVVVALITPSIIALFGITSLGHQPEWLNAQVLTHRDLFVLQYTLLTVGLSVAVVSCALATYHRSLPRRLLHLSLFCILLELFYRFAYGGAVSSGILLSVPETSGRETSELLAGHPILTASLVLMALLAIYALIVSWRTHLRFPLGYCTGVGAVSIAMILASLAIGKYQFGDTRLLKPVVLSEVQDIFPFDVVTAVAAVANGLIDTKRLASTRAGFEFPNVYMVNAASRRKAAEIYVVVVGETSRRANWSLFGYSRATTPRLDVMRNDLILFDRVTSNATNTILSVPLALTRAAPATRAVVHSEKSIITLLRQAGFETYWISNQARSDALFNPISQIALEADHVAFPEDIPPRERNDGFDSNLLVRLNELMARLPSQAKAVIFLHMEGSHFGYKERYPASFSHFRAGWDAPRVLPERQMRLVDEYDNSVYFTDYNIRGIIDRLALCHCKAGLIFFSDHGERLFDHGLTDSDFGHGFPTVSRQEIEVPLFIWLSSAYDEANPEQVARLKANAHSAVELHSVFETIADMTGVHYENRTASLSLFSANLQSPNRLEVLNTNEETLSLAVPVYEGPDDPAKVTRRWHPSDLKPPSKLNQNRLEAGIQIESPQVGGYR
jgi:glucan phosphoethanolaminetransferase (alkaline phosphatase superfamily)